MLDGTLEVVAARPHISLLDWAYQFALPNRRVSQGGHQPRLLIATLHPVATSWIAQSCSRDPRLIALGYRKSKIIRGENSPQPVSPLPEPVNET